MSGCIGKNRSRGGFMQPLYYRQKLLVKPAPTQLENIQGQLYHMYLGWCVTLPLTHPTERALLFFFSLRTLRTLRFIKKE